MVEKLKELFGFTEGTSGASLDIEVRHKKQMNFMIVMLSFLTIVIGLIGASYSSVVEKLNVTIELPPSVMQEATIKVGNGWSNDLYMKVWGDWFVNETANFAPGDIKDKFGQAIRFFLQDKVSDYAGQFGALSNLVIRNQLKQTFTVKHVDATYYEDTEFQEQSSDDQNIRGAVFEYTGVATQSLGNSALPDHDCKYSISMKLEGGHLYGYSYNTDCFK